MRICQYSTVHSIKDTRIFLKQCTSLVRMGYDVTLYAKGDYNGVKSGVKLKSLGLKEQNRFFRMFIFQWLMIPKLMRENADVYHFHDPELLLSGCLLRILGKKVVYDIHEDLPSQLLSKHYLAGWLRKYIAFSVKYVEKILSGLMSGVVVVHENVFKRFVHRNEEALYLPNYPLLDELNLEAETSWEMRENASAFVGGISEIRGLKEMVLANKAANLHLYLAGPIQSQIMMNDLTSGDMKKTFTYLDTIPRKKVGELLSRVKMGLIIYHPLPHHVSSLPTKILEYMSAGIPVIASNFPVLLEIVKKYNCGICVDPQNLDEIADAMKKISEGDTFSEKLGKNGRDAVLAEYNWEKLVVNLDMFYKTLIQR